MRFDGEGHEQRGVRPGVVFQNNRGSEASPNIIALPMSSSIKKMGLPTHVFVDGDRYGLTCDSVVLCENPQRMSKGRLLRWISRLDEDVMRRIAIASLLATSAISYLTQDELLDTWRKAISFND